MFWISVWTQTGWLNQNNMKPMTLMIWKAPRQMWLNTSGWVVLINLLDWEKLYLLVFTKQVGLSIVQVLIVTDIIIMLMFRAGRCYMIHHVVYDLDSISEGGAGGLSHYHMSHVDKFSDIVTLGLLTTICDPIWDKIPRSHEIARLRLRLRLHWLETSQVSTWPHQLEDVEESHSVDSGLLC